MMKLIGRDSKGNAILKTQYIHALYLTPTKNIGDQVTVLMFEVSSSITFYQFYHVLSVTRPTYL